MSQDNVEIVRAQFGALEGVNVAAIDWSADAIRDVLGRAYHPEIELTTLPSGFGSGVGDFYKGVDGGVRYLQEWLEPFSDYRIENLDYIDAGDCVVVPSRQWGIGSGSGARVEIELTTLYELHDGKITRIQQYDTLEEALDGAGLRR
jgi:ketosteroid isomerase-like protein